LIRLLPAAETEQLDRRPTDIFTWASQAPAVYLSHGCCDDAGMVPTLLLSLQQQQLFASVAYTAGFQVVQSGGGAAAEASWAPLQQASGRAAAHNTFAWAGHLLSLSFVAGVVAGSSTAADATATADELRPCV
jgi:hypothetical protein